MLAKKIHIGNKKRIQNWLIYLLTDNWQLKWLVAASLSAEIEDFFVDFLLKIGEKNMANNIEVVFGFDNTGSMYLCLI